jgi:hypothetical protein
LGLGGVWVRDPDAPPPDNSALKTLEDALDANLKDFSERSAKLDQELANYTKKATDFNNTADQLTQKISSLPDPTSAIKDVKINYGDSKPGSGGLSPVDAKVLDKMGDAVIGGPIGKGQCVDLVRSMTGLGPAKETWKPNGAVSTSDFTPLKPIATFFGGVYPSNDTGNHAAILLQKNDDGSIVVFDQYKGKPPGIRVIRDKGGKDANTGTPGYNASNDAANYSYVQSQ